MGTQNRRFIPTAPSGLTVGSYEAYEEAQRAVDFLSDQRFPVEHCTIVGSDLKLVEHITGSLNWVRAGGAGAASGAWFGVLIGLLLGLLAPTLAGWLILLAYGLLVGAGFGLLFALVSYALTQGRRDFVSLSQLTASRYEVMCPEPFATEARTLLAKMN